MIEIRALAPDLLSDYLAYFDHDAFADNPRWASCYCYFHHAPHDREEWQRRDGEQNRAAAGELIRSGQMGGYLAYSEGRPVGWCNVNWRHAYTTLDPAPASDARTVAIVCFVVAKAFRGRGIAGRLLDAACVGARQLGATEIEAYPLGDSADEAANHYGPLPMYLAAGFEAVSEQDGRVTVRKALNGASQPATGI